MRIPLTAVIVTRYIYIVIDDMYIGEPLGCNFEITLVHS